MDVILLNVQFVACNHNTKALGRLKSGSPNLPSGQVMVRPIIGANMVKLLHVATI